MIGFKKVPTKLVLSAFFISIIFILLLYTDTVLNKPLPEEEIKITIIKDLAPKLYLKLMRTLRRNKMKRKRTLMRMMVHQKLRRKKK